MASNTIAMEDCAKAKGVFLFTKNLDSELMLRCLQTLLNNFPVMKFTSITVYEKCLGYSVHFSDPDVEAVLAKRHLSVSGQDIQICPLTTCLTIHDINTNGDSQLLESHIREAINSRFGKLLCSISISRSPGCQNGNSKNWRAYIDIPEVKDLAIFDHEGFSEMCMWLPNKKEKLKVTFCCRRCKKDGHVQQDCLYEAQRKASTTEEKVNKNESKSLASAFATSFKICLDSTETFAEIVGREEVMKTGIILGENQKVKEAGPSESTPDAKGSNKTNLPSLDWSSIKIKEETEEKDDHTQSKDKTSQNTEDSKNVPKEQSPNMLNNHENSNSPMDDDDDIQVIEYRDNSNSSNTHHSFRLKSEETDEAATSDHQFLAETLFQIQAETSQRSLSNSSAIAGPSYSNHNATRPSTSVEITSVLSEQLQDCINSACNEFQILNRQTLDAFLIHVKKKSNPIRIAKNYTDQPAMLKKQLQHILTLYYNTPQTGTKDDTQFIKWLEGLVKRFEGTVPRKRKRAGENLDDISSKK